MTLVTRSAVVFSAMVLSASVFAATPVAKPVPAHPAAAPVAGMTEKQRNSYMIGMDVAKSLGQIKDEVDISALTRAMQDVFSGKPTALTEAQAEQVRAAFSQKMQAKMQSLQSQQATKNLAAGTAFLAANRTKPHPTTAAARDIVLNCMSFSAPSHRISVESHRPVSAAVRRLIEATF